MAEVNKLVIDRERWARGMPTVPRTANFLLGRDGTMCCLGFCMAQLGVRADALLDEGEPYDAINEARDEFAKVSGLLVLADEYEDEEDEEDGETQCSFRDTDLVSECISHNDNSEMVEAEREAAIVKAFSAAGVAVTFVDTAEETEALCGMPKDFGR